MGGNTKKNDKSDKRDTDGGNFRKSLRRLVPINWRSVFSARTAVKIQVNGVVVMNEGENCQQEIVLEMKQEPELTNAKMEQLDPKPEEIEKKPKKRKLKERVLAATKLFPIRSQQKKVEAEARKQGTEETPMEVEESREKHPSPSMKIQQPLKENEENIPCNTDVKFSVVPGSVSLPLKEGPTLVHQVTQTNGPTVIHQQTQTDHVHKMLNYGYLLEGQPAGSQLLHGCLKVLKDPNSSLHWRFALLNINLNNFSPSQRRSAELQIHHQIMSYMYFNDVVFDYIFPLHLVINPISVTE